MTVYFINKTKQTVIVELGGNKITLNNDEKINIDCKTDKMCFNCYLKENSTFKYLPLSNSVIIEYNFVLNSLYELTLCNDFCEIYLIHKKVKGNNLEWYKYIDLQLNDANVNYKEFSVQDELSAKKELAYAREKEVKLEKKLKIIDILQTVCYIGIPALIILLGIWYFADLKTALTILIPLTFVGVFVGLTIKKILNKFNNKLEKINSQFEKKDNEYIDIHSFFNKNYIYNVVNDINK